MSCPCSKGDGCGVLDLRESRDHPWAEDERAFYTTLPADSFLCSTMILFLKIRLDCTHTHIYTRHTKLGQNRPSQTLLKGPTVLEGQFDNIREYCTLVFSIIPVLGICPQDIETNSKQHVQNFYCTIFIKQNC
jgi:hypothetical protein